jgi:hypothetical protein
MSMDSAVLRQIKKQVARDCFENNDRKDHDRVRVREKEMPKNRGVKRLRIE